MIKPGPAFTRPRTPAAKCLHLVRLNPIITRSELVEATGLSQPTITRATAALLKAGLIQERNDLTQSHGRGRPTVPLEIANNNWMLAGIAVGTSSTRIAFYDPQGHAIREDDIDTPVAELSADNFIETIMAGVNRLRVGLDRQLVSVGVSTSGSVDSRGLVYASNLGWYGVDIAERRRCQFGVPVVVASAIPAILGAETQAGELNNSDHVLVLFADDSIGAAVATDTAVTQITPLPAVNSPSFNGDQDSEGLLNTSGTLAALAAQGIKADSLGSAVSAATPGSPAREILDERARLLGELTAELVKEHDIRRVVVAGSAFSEDPAAPKIFAARVRELASPTAGLELRMIPTHQEIVRAVARAVALDPLLRIPLSLEQ